MRILPRGPWYYVVLRLFVALPLAMYVVYLGTMLLLQDALLFPSPDIPADTLARQAANVGANELHIPTTDGEQVYGWHFEGTQPKVVLYFHGNGGSVHNAYHLKKLLGPTWHVVGASYQGYSGGTGRTTEETLALSGRGAWTYLVDELGFSADQIVVHGRSLGGSVAVKVAAEHQPAALVMESTFLSMTEVAQSKHPLLPVGWLLRHPLKSRDRAPHVRSPTLVLHSSGDGLIPVDHGRELAKLFPAATYVERPDYGHNHQMIGTDEAVTQAYLAHINTVGTTP